MKLIAREITKDYPGCRALNRVSVEMTSGKVHALVGKNGSGKSTLVKLFAGVIQPTSGALMLDDEELHFGNPVDAQEKGIVTVYQEMSLVPGLTIAENIFLNRMPHKNRATIDWKAAYRQAKEHLSIMGVDLDPKEKVENLSMWQRQIVEITKALSFSPRVLMLDEPTSALAQGEVQNLLKFINSLKKQDLVIIYITHKLHELAHVADDVIVLRDGALVGQKDIHEIDHEGIVHMMFGDVNIRRRPEHVRSSEETVLSVKNLTRARCYHDVSFELKKGEILGIAGMLGSGRTELLRGIFGADPFHSGSIVYDGETIQRTHPIQMISHGFGLTPEERKVEGLILIHSIRDNLCYASMRKISPGVLENKKLRKEIADKQVRELEIKVPDVSDACNSLSGGNQQKVVVGNWLNTGPKIMMYDEPSRGIDVSAKQQIFEIMWEQSAMGISAIFVSSELEELLEVCHRILIMKDGAILGAVDPDQISIEELYACCMSGILPKQSA